MGKVYKFYLNKFINTNYLGFMLNVFHAVDFNLIELLSPHTNTLISN